MSPRLPTIVLCLLSAASVAFAQADDPPFWKQPGQVTKNDAGEVISAEIRDPSAYKVRLFSNGVWTTQYYRPHTTQVLKVETPDTVEDWLYDQHGKYDGLRIHINGVALELHSDALGKVVSAPGVAPISIEKDRGGRVTAIRDAKGADLARFNFDQQGYLRSLDTGSQRLEIGIPAGGRVQETLMAGSRVLKSVTVAGSVSNPHSLPFCLDIVRPQLSAPDDWRDQLKFRYSSNNSVATALDAAGKPLIYIVTHGNTRFAYDTAGRPLFIDVRVHLPYETVEHEADTAAQIYEQGAVAPNHVVITSDGRVGACTEGAAAGAIASFWTERIPNGATVTRFRTYGDPQPSKPKGVAPQAQPGSASSLRRLHAAPDVYYYICDATTVCMIGPDWCGCDSCNTTYVYCAGDTGDGGTSSGGGSTGSTGGGGSSASNQITGDAALQAKVQTAISTAATKLQNCGSSLTSLMALNGQSLGTMLAGKAGGPWSMASFIQGGANGTGQAFQMDTAANPNGICAAGNPAYTSLYQNVTFICEQQFLQLTAAQQYVRLIHEELHTLGYPENPPTAWAQTPAQISAMVAQRCP